MGPPLQEDHESIISFAIERSIRHHPDQAALEMLKLIREKTRLEGELFILREKLLNLARPAGVVR